MQIFKPTEGKFKDIADKYKKSGEVTRISMPIEFEGKIYREIVYNKTFFGRMKRNITGLIFINEDGEHVSNERLKKELCNLSYYFESLLDDSSIKELNNALASEIDIKKQMEDYEQISSALIAIKSEKLPGIGEVITILNELPNHKIENNKTIEEYLNQLQLITPEEFVFNKIAYNELYSYYREILIKNFQRVMLVNSGRDYYDDIKKESQKRKRSMTARLNTQEVFIGLSKLPVEMDHLKNILRVYESVADMKQEEYLKHLKDIEKNNINYRFQLIR